MPTKPAASVLPGIALAGGVAAAGFAAADVLGGWLLAAQGIAASGAGSPVSGIPLAILLGLAVNNAGPALPDSVRPGLKACTTTVLRAGIICVGAKLSLIDVAKLGAAGVPAVAAAIGAGLTFVPWLARRAGLPPRMGALIAAGTSICGVTAITALAPAIKATPRETAVAVANVVAFGTFGMLAYPYLAHYLLAPESAQVGLFLGTAVHDTSQVLGSAMTYKEVYGDEAALQCAAVTKLTRNLFLAGVIPGLTWASARAQARLEAEEAAAAAAAAKAAEANANVVDVGVGGSSGSGGAAAHGAKAPVHSCSHAEGA